MSDKKKLKEDETLINELTKDMDEIINILKEQELESSYEHGKWLKDKTKMKYLEVEQKRFPIINNHIYWAFLGSNIGSEQEYHRPVLVVQTHKDSPICSIIPLTLERLGDEYWYHIDLENMNSTALVEQLRVISKIRIDKPMWESKKIKTITDNDWKKINRQLSSLYILKPLINPDNGKQTK